MPLTTFLRELTGGLLLTARCYGKIAGVALGLHMRRRRA